MANLITKYAAKKILGGKMKQFSKRGKENGPESRYDPYFDVIYDERKGRSKKVRKQIPAYIPEHDATILAKMRNRSYKLDMGLFNLFGLRFGWSSVIGLIPGFGDIADMLLALLLIQRCQKVECGLGATVQAQMYFNLALDFVVGIIPFIGDLADAAYKANTRNVRLLEERLDEVYKPKEMLRKEKEMRRSWHPKNEDDVMGKPPAPATAYEDFSDSEDEYVPARQGREPARPQQAFFGGGRERRADEEMGGAHPQQTGTVRH